MSLSDLISEQMKAIAASRKDLLQKTRKAEDLATPNRTLKTRVARIDARIKTLQKQKTDTVKRLDAAIAEQIELKKRIEKEAEQWGKRTGRKTLTGKTGKRKTVAKSAPASKTASGASKTTGGKAKREPRTKPK